MCRAQLLPRRRWEPCGFQLLQRIICGWRASSRYSDSLLENFVVDGAPRVSSFSDARVAGFDIFATPTSVRPMFHRLGDVIVGGRVFRAHSSQTSVVAGGDVGDGHAARKLMDRFWMELPAREKSAVLRGADVWCVPVPALRLTLGQLAEAGADCTATRGTKHRADYARRLEHVDVSARRYVAAGLNE